MKIEPSTIEMTHRLEISDAELAFLEYVCGYDLLRTCSGNDKVIARAEPIQLELRGKFTHLRERVNKTRTELGLPNLKL